MKLFQGKLFLNDNLGKKLTYGNLLIHKIIYSSLTNW